jgi:hypothetical protein
MCLVCVCERITDLAQIGRHDNEAGICTSVCLEKEHATVSGKATYCTSTTQPRSPEAENAAL